MKKILFTLTTALMLVPAFASAASTTTATTAATGTAPATMPAGNMSSSASMPSANTAPAAPTSAGSASTGTTGTGAGTTMHSNPMHSKMPMSGKMVHVNTASATELTTIPGVNAKIAADIVKNRPYKNSAELVKKVKGIGKKNVLKMAPYLNFM